MAKSAAGLRAPAGAVVGGLRGTRQWPAATAGLLPRTGGKPGRLGKFFVESARARVSRQPPATGALGRLCRLGGRDRKDLSAGASPTLLGAQDAQPARWGAAARSSEGQTRRPAHLPGPQRRPGAPGFPTLSLSLAQYVSPSGPAARARS